ncbi:MAG: LON peptidase substrate-binding domain-containing protein, partial [Nitrospirota bacterium]
MAERNEQPQEEQQVEIPDKLPLLPIRDIVIFPYMILPLFVGRDMSIKAIDDALSGNRLILLVAQKDLNTENPEPKDLYPTGTVGMIMRMLKLPDGRVKILVQGMSKAIIKDYVQTDPYFLVNIDKIVEPKEPKLTLEVEALMRNVKEQLEKMISLGKMLLPDIMVIVENIDDPGKLADLVASNLGLKVEIAQEVLEILDPRERLTKVNEIISKELEVLSMQQKIQASARGEIDKSQREYFLREQLKAIQKELGESDERTEE